MTTKNVALQRLSTGIPNLDVILGGGLPKGSVTVLSGPPGSGKTTLSQQICFHAAASHHRSLYFSTLSEPTTKTLHHLQQFQFFDPTKFGRSVEFVDLGVLLRSQGLDGASALIMEHVKRVKPTIVVIDSFRTFDDLARTDEELRKFVYELTVNLMAWETTVLLLGEYGTPESQRNSLFTIVDGLIVLSQRDAFGEPQRFCKITKMRGTAHSRDDHPFVITKAGIEMFSPQVSLRRDPAPHPAKDRCQTCIPKLDELLGTGIPWGSSLLVGGVAGTGKTVLSLEFVYRGALAGEKGIIFSFEETDERLLAAAKGLGWNLEREIDRGMVEIVFIPQPEITVEAHLLMIKQRVEALKAKRVVIDSVSVFLHKVTDPQVSREKIFHLCSIVQNAQAVGFFTTDIPYGSKQVSRFGVEETVVDGVIILSSVEEGQERERYLEVYKLRNTAHLKGRHNMVIGPGGIAVYPRYGKSVPIEVPPPALQLSARLKSGVPGLDRLLEGGLIKRSVTLVSGSAGIGKTTMALQFILEGARRKQRGLYVTLEEGADQLVASADALGLPLRSMMKKGLVEVMYVSREHLRTGQFLTVLADRLTKMKAQRVVVDAATQLVTENTAFDEFRHMLYRLLVRFKTLDITSILTLEASSLLSTERVTEQGLSPLADNLLMLRYRGELERLVPTLTIVKTRGSVHERSTHLLTVGRGGVQVGEVANAHSVATSSGAAADPPKKRLSRTP